MFTVEKMKIRKNGLVIVSLILMSLALFIGSVLYYANQEVFIDDDTQWLAIWGQSGMFFMQMFFPVLIGIVVGISCKVEHDHKNWQRMAATGISYSKMIRSKWSVLGFYSGMCLLVFLSLFYVIGLFFLGLPFSVNDLLLILFWAFWGWLGSLSICSFQLYIAIKMKSFAASVCVAVGGTLIGFILMVVVPPLTTVFPYLQLAAGSRTRALVSFSQGEFVVFIVVNLLISYVFYWLSCQYLERKEFD